MRAVLRVAALAPIVFAAGCSLLLSFDDGEAGGAVQVIRRCG